MNIALWETRIISLTFPQVRETVTKREAKGRHHGMCAGKWKEHQRNKILNCYYLPDWNLGMFPVSP